MIRVLNKSILDIVEENFHTAAVFEKYGISFYDGDNKNTLRHVCMERNLDFEKIEEELLDVSTTCLISQKLPFSRWRLEFLMDYIKHVHHDYAAIVIPELEAGAGEMIEACAEKHPFLSSLATSLRRLKTSILAHNLQEEEIIFPYIRQLENLAEKNDGVGFLFVRTLRKPLESIRNGHEIIDRLLGEISKLTNDFTMPDMACTRVRVFFRQLKELQYKLLEHKYLENNILFPRALNLEKRLLAEEPE